MFSIKKRNKTNLKDTFIEVCPANPSCRKEDMIRKYKLEEQSGEPHGYESVLKSDSDICCGNCLNCKNSKVISEEAFLNANSNPYKSQTITPLIILYSITFVIVVSVIIWSIIGIINSSSINMEIFRIKAVSGGVIIATLILCFFIDELLEKRSVFLPFMGVFLILSVRNYLLHTTQYEFLENTTATIYNGYEIVSKKEIENYYVFHKFWYDEDKNEIHVRGIKLPR